MSQRAVITGGAGFLGSHLCERFLAEGWSVLCIDNLLTGNRANIEHLLDDERFEFMEHDVTKYIEVDGEDEAARMKAHGGAVQRG